MSSSNSFDQDVRWGILGTGYIAERFATEANQADGASVVAVSGRSQERTAAFAQRNGIANVRVGYESLLTDPEVEVVYVATPHTLHYEQALAALRHGKAVLVEKPMTMNRDEAESLAREARERGLFLMEGMWTLCNPLVVQLASRIREGAIGQVLMFTANVGPLAVPHVPGSGGRFEDPDLGASFMLECLVYPLAVLGAVAPAFLDAPEVTAAATFNNKLIDDAASILLRTQSGAVASVSGSFAFSAKQGSASRAQITGSHGCAEIVDDIFNPTSIWIATREGIDVLESNAAERGFAWEIEEASRNIRAGRTESEHVSLEASIKTMGLLDRARASANITVGGTP